MSQLNLYPLKFTPILKDKIWGGTKLSEILDKQTGDSKICGESWEISGVPNNISEVSEGDLKGKLLTELIDEYKGDLIGEHIYQKFGNKFPLLIKFIDANDDLSIQVHPDDTLAQKRHNSFGKTEMWYVVNAEEGATLISGFNRKTDKDEYVKIFEDGRVNEILNKEVANNDDVFFLPAGRVHTIGKGLLIAEIQQTSDITYRIYDFDRVDADGNKRELHVEEDCQYFATKRLIVEVKESRDYSEVDSCVILMCLEGSGTLEFKEGSIDYKLGDSILVPNAISKVDIKATVKTKLLEVTIP